MICVGGRADLCIVSCTTRKLRAGHWKTKAKNDPEGFEAFKKEQFGEESKWSKDLSISKMQLVFTYYKQFKEIRDSESQLSAR